MKAKIITTTGKTPQQIEDEINEYLETNDLVSIHVAHTDSYILLIVKKNCG